MGTWTLILVLYGYGPAMHTQRLPDPYYTKESCMKAVELMAPKKVQEYYCIPSEAATRGK